MGKWLGMISGYNLKNAGPRSFFFIIIIGLLFGSLPISLIAADENGSAPDPADCVSETSSRANQKPVVNIDNPIDQSDVKGIVNITGTAYDDIRVLNVIITIFKNSYNATDTSVNGTWETWYHLLDTEFYPNGVFTVEVTAYDNESYSKSSINIMINNTEVPTIPPRVWIDTPADNEKVKGSIKITGRAVDDVLVTGVKLTVNGKDYTAFDNTVNNSWYKWLFDLDTTKLADGSYNLTAKAGDGLSTGLKKIRIRVNNNGLFDRDYPPSITITRPLNGTVVFGEIDVSGTAEDDNGVISVNIYVNDNKFTPEDTSGNGSWYKWNIILNTLDYPNGWLTLTAEVYDNNRSVNDSVRIFLDNPDNHKPPIIRFLYPEDDDDVFGYIYIGGIASYYKTLEYVKLIISGVEYVPEDKSDNKTWYIWDIRFNTSILPDGSYMIEAVTGDSEFEGRTTITINVNNSMYGKKNQAPKIEIRLPQHGKVVSGTINIEGIAVDPDNSIEYVYIRIGTRKILAVDDSFNGSWYHWYLRVDTEKFDSGWIKITAVAFDSFKEGSDSIDVQIKKIIPNKCPDLKIISPAPGTILAGDVIISGTTEDDDEVNYVKVKVDGVLYNATDTSPDFSWSTWEFELKTDILADGSYTILVLASDGKCNYYVELDIEISNSGTGDKFTDGSVDPNDSGSSPSEEHKPFFRRPKTVSAFIVTIISLSIFVLFGFIIETGKYKMLTVFVVPLYVKRKLDKVLDNFIRGEVYGFIRANPGTYFNHIKLELELNNGTLAYHLSVLERDNLIISRADGKYRRFYPRNTNIPKVEEGGDGMIHTFVQLNSTQDEIINRIKQNPGVSQKDLARMLGRSTQVVNYNINAMARLGLIKLERDGKWTKCYVNGMYKIDEPSDVVWED